MRRVRRAAFALVGVAAVGGVMLTALPLWADDGARFDAVADTTLTQVPQDGDNSVRATLATCPRLCDGNPHGERDAVLEFSVQGLPSGATDVRARLEVWSWQPFAATVAAHQADSGAHGAGYGGWPTLSPELDARSSVVQGYNRWDVSAAVRGNGTYTFALTQSGRNSRIYWASRENTRADLRPHLVVSYRAVTGTPPVHTATVGPQSPGATTSAPVPGPSSSGVASRTSGPEVSTSARRSAGPSPSVPGWRLAWSDEFDGSELDRTRWTAKDNTMVDYDLACITDRPQNVFVGGGVLTLRAREERATCGSETRGYTTAYLDSAGKASFTYGRFEVRAKSPTGPTTSTGLWPAFWLRPDDGGHGEIDVTELPGGDAYYRAATQAILYDYTPVVKQDNRYPFQSGHPADGFHTYTTEWEPGVLRWYVDGQLAYQRDRTTTSWFDQAFSRPYHLRLNLQVGGWLGSPDTATAFPADFQVDYVRVWRR